MRPETLAALIVAAQFVSPADTDDLSVRARSVGVTAHAAAAVQVGVQVEPGTVRVGILRPGGGYTVTSMPLEEYVGKVLSGEGVRQSQPAALQALAITIRTFALANRGRHRADGFDLCDQTHCQVVRPATPPTELAARETAGRVLMVAGAPASVFYTASCGGRTEIPSNVWPGADDPSYLPTREDDGCGGAPEWSAEISEPDLLKALRASGFRGDRLKELRVRSRNSSGRVARLTLDGLRPGEISGQDLRVVVGRTLGWQHIKSTMFDLRRVGGAYRFSGHGSGHGVGMCVIGAARLAERGQSAEQILSRYFPGLDVSAASAARLTRAAPTAPPPARGAAVLPASPVPESAVRATAPGPEVLVSLPDEDEGEHEAIVRQASVARDELARALGVTPPARVSLRVHPTTEDYAQATGQPWFTSGAIVNNELHLPPLAVLRERGVLDRAIRHGLVHVLIDAALSKRPMWVREGAAIYFAGEVRIPGEPVARPPSRPEPRASCPDAPELLQPVSVGALSNAWARARACFAKQIQAGRGWRDVR